MARLSTQRLLEGRMAAAAAQTDRDRPVLTDSG